MTSVYDQIAHLYDVDMARNMPFDDVSLYADLAQRAGGRVLELGCGNGRILLELLRRGIDAYGVDRSAAMLEHLREKAGSAIAGRVCRMDARALAFPDAFALVLCPYSLITYMAAERDVERMLDGIRRALSIHGRVVIDAFVPRSGMSNEILGVDYLRPFRNGVLTRAKRIAALGARLNRIERHYEILGADGSLIEEIDTCEDIRLFAPDDVRASLTGAGFRIDAEWWDYAAGGRHSQPQFFTVAATPLRRNRAYLA
jgi:SAM-dependent methyltransferase